MVFLETLVRRADRANYLCAQIFFATDPIVQLLLGGIVEEPVDSKISPLGIGHGIAERNPFRVASILVIAFGTEGGDLKLMLFCQHDHHSKLPPDRDRA